MNRFHESTNHLLKRAVPWSVLGDASQAWRRKEAKSCLPSSLIPRVLVTPLVDGDIERHLQIAGFGQKASRKQVSIIFMACGSSSHAQSKSRCLWMVQAAKKSQVDSASRRGSRHPRCSNMPVSIMSWQETLMKWWEYSKYVSVSSWTFLLRFHNGEDPVPVSKAYFLGSMWYLENVRMLYLTGL